MFATLISHTYFEHEYVVVIIDYCSMLDRLLTTLNSNKCSAGYCALVSSSLIASHENAAVEFNDQVQLLVTYATVPSKHYTVYVLM